MTDVAIAAETEPKSEAGRLSGRAKLALFAVAVAALGAALAAAIEKKLL